VTKELNKKFVEITAILLTHSFPEGMELILLEDQAIWPVFEADNVPADGFYFYLKAKKQEKFFSHGFKVDSLDGVDWESLIAREIEVFQKELALHG